MELSATVSTLGFIGNLGWPEILVIMVIMLILFGRRLPEVGRSLGKGIVEFKKGVKGIDDDVDQQSQRPPYPQQPYPQQAPYQQPPYPPQPYQSQAWQQGGAGQLPAPGQAQGAPAPQQPTSHPAQGGQA